MMAPGDASGVWVLNWRNDEGTGGEPPPTRRDGERPRLWRDDEGVPQTKTLTERAPAGLWDDRGRAETPTRAPARPSESPLWQPREDRAGQTRDVAFRRPASPPAATARPHEERAPARRRTRIGLLTVTIVLALVVALIADAAYVGLGLARSLTSTRATLQVATDSVSEVDIAAARAAFAEGVEETSRAVSLTRHPAFRLATLLPRVGPDARSVGAIARATQLTARAGLAGTDALEALGAEEEGIAGSLYRDGRVDFAALAAAEPAVAEASRLLQRAAVELGGAPTPATDIVRDAYFELRRRVDDAGGLARKGAVTLGLLPSLLGGEGRRRYLLAFQALGEARGTGGVIGSFGVLAADEGRPDLVEVAPFGDVFPRELPQAVSAPEWFERNYGPQNALRQVQQANLTPNFPVAARVLLEMYEATTGERLDGVIAMDPVALARLTEATGPVRGEGLDVDVGPDNAVDVLLHDSYTEFEREADQNAYLASVVDDFWNTVEEADFDGAAFAIGLADMARAGHVKVSTSDPDEQAALGELGASGDFTAAGPDVQLVFHNNYGINKVDYFLHRTIRTLIRLDTEGTAHVHTALTLHNRAPQNTHPGLLGQGDDATNRMLLGVVAPEGSTFTGLLVDGEEAFPYEYADSGYPLAWYVLDLPPGERTRVQIDYDAPARYEDDLYTITLFPQAVVNPDAYSLTIVPPDGQTARDADRPGSEETESYRMDGTLEEPLTIRLELTPTEGS